MRKIVLVMAVMCAAVGGGGGCSTAATDDAPDRNGDGTFGFTDLESTATTEARMGQPRKWEDEFREHMDKQSSEYYERQRD